jgi:hypothetical protein
MTISGTLITANHATDVLGAGIFTAQPLEITNSTISGNNAGTGTGGGLYQEADPISISHVTFAGNDSSGDDAIHGDSSDVTLHASIIDNGLTACNDAIATTGYNVDAGTSCGLGVVGDTIGTSGRLKPLADNGGPLVGLPALAGPALTHALKKSSPAIDRVPKRKCVDAAGKRLRKDQRAVRRPQGRRCDSGAYERK